MNYQSFSFLPNRQKYVSAYFPIPVRGSSTERVIRHSSEFVLATTCASLSYYLFADHLKQGLAKAAKTCAHKLLIAPVFYYTHELVYNWLRAQEAKRSPSAPEKRISAWSSFYPLFFAVNKAFQLPLKRTALKSLSDVLLLSCFCLYQERNLRFYRKVLVEGSEEQKKQAFKYLATNRSKRKDE